MSNLREEKLKKIEEMKKKNQEKEKEIQKQKEQKAAEANLDNFISNAQDADPNTSKKIIYEAIEKEKLENERRKQLAKEKFEKMSKYKSDYLKETNNTNEYSYLPLLKDYIDNEIQCDIVSGDPRQVAMERFDIKKKKPRAKAIEKFINQLKKGAFIKSLIETENIKEVNEQNEKKRNEILQVKSKEIKDFLNDKRIELFENALRTKDIFDTFKDYYNDNENNNSEYKRNWLQNPVELYDESIISKRSVTSIEFGKSSELLLASFSSEFGSQDRNEPNGLMILYNSIKKKPELVFKHQTEITSCCFQNSNPKQIIAGTYTGQILIYDIRVGNTPVLKSPLSTKQQSLPIYYINNFGLNNSNQIVSISNDGLVCMYNITNFSKALKKIELKKGVENKTSTGVNMEEIGVISASIRSDNDYLYVGSDDSNIYQVYLGQG